MRNQSIQRTTTLLLILFNLLAGIINVSAQNNPYNEVSIASPTAASLGKYADIPVNNHTGIPNISIPIYTVKEGSLELPISLSYHAGGLKVLEPASWVGAGWSLNAGGVITRTVRGAPDERKTSSVFNQDYGYFSDYGYNSYAYYQVQGVPENFSEADEFLKGMRDGEPDLFTFNAGGITGKFYFRDDRTPVFEPQQNIKVEYVYTGVGSIQSFVLIGPDGTRYHFGVRNDPAFAIPVERTNVTRDASQFQPGTAISSWYLSKIESADGLSNIKLNYSSEEYSYHTLSMPPLESNNEWLIVNETMSSGYLNNQFDYLISKNVVQGVRLASINYTYGKVTFNADLLREDLGKYTTNFAGDAPNASEVVYTQAKALESIQVEDVNATFCKKFTFSYDYFVDNTPLQGYFANYGITTDKKRLKLNKLQEVICFGYDEPRMPPYAFEYYTEQVRRRLSFGQDHWGFANGITSNTKLMPTYTENDFTTIPGANRDPLWPAMRGGTLKRITYPTGGVSELEFEANSAWTQSVRYSETTGPSMSIGYTNTTNPVQQTVSLSGAPYRVQLSNNAVGGTAKLTVYNASNTVVAYLEAAAGTSKELTQSFQAGSHLLVFSKENMAQSGYGADVSFYKKVAENYVRNEMVGGLRIKAMIHRDNVTAQSTVTSYSYIDGNGKSSGVLYGRPTYVQVVRNDEMAAAGFGGPYGTGPAYSNCSPNGCTSCEFFSGANLNYYKSAGGLRPLANFQGNHIGYNEVKVSQSGNGSTVYRYYGSDKWDAEIGDISIRNVNTKPPCSLTIPNYPDAPLPFEPKRGELKTESHFTEAGQWIKEVEYYPVYSEEPVKTPGRIMTVAYMKFSTYYELKAFKKTSQTIIKKQIGTPTLTTTKSTYSESQFHYQPTKTSLTSSSGSIVESRFKYPADYRLGNCDAISNCNSTYESAVNSAISIYNQARNSCTTDGCVWNTYQQYRGRLALARRNYLDCRKAYVSTTNSAGFAKCWSNARDAAGTELKPIIEMVDRNMLFPIEVTQWRDGKLISADFNRYDYVTNPTGMVYLNKTQKINLRSPSSTFAASIVSGSTISKDSRYLDEDLVKFDKGRLVEITKRDGLVSSFVWGYNNSYPVAKVIGASYSAINSMIEPLKQDILQNPESDHEMRKELNKLRSLSNTLVSTSTYNPFIGITSETDQKNVTTFYQYDDQGRLAVVRDRSYNVVKKYCYNYQGQVENCNTISNPTGTFIYPVVEVTNQENNGTAIYGDVFIKFYSDPNYEIPVSVSDYLVESRKYTFTCPDFSYPAFSGNSLITCNGTYHYLGRLLLSWNDNTKCESYDYRVR